MRGLTDKIVIITGGGSGLGRGMAKRLAVEGAIIIIFDIDKKGAAETLEDIDQGASYEVDISDYKACESAVAKVVKDFGQLDILVNNLSLIHI